jgi:two-component system sensor histidine kinase BaeS
VFLTIAAVSFVTLVGVGLFSSHTTTTDLERFNGPVAVADGDRIARAVEAAYDKDPSLAGLTRSLTDIGNAAHGRVLLVAPRGGVLASSDPALATMRATIDADGTLHLGGSPESGATSMIVLRSPTARISDRKRRVAALMYVLPAADPALPSRQSLAGDIARSIWIAVGLAAIVAFAAAIVLSTHILRPVEALTTAAGRLARGDLKARVAATGGDEIGALGRSFNAMADELTRLERLREAMVADIAHELRTPLTHIRGRVEAIQDGKMAPTSAIIAALKADVDLLERLVRDLQDLSLADAGQLVLVPRRLSVAQEVDFVAASLPDVQSRVPAGVPDVMADAERMRQVLQNLVANARAHAREGGAVWIAATAASSEVHVTVRNDGATLEERELSAIFERFYRADKSRSRSTGGAGLGLAIVKQLVEASGGRVWAENTADPEGVSVTFTLPIAS